MSLVQEAQRMAAEFEYPAEEVNKGVKAFMSQMGKCRVEGLHCSQSSDASRRGRLRESGCDDEPDSDVCYSGTDRQRKGVFEILNVRS